MSRRIPEFPGPGRCVLAWSLMVAASAAETHGQVGDVEFRNSGAPVAQTAFLHGLAQLHNFQYGEAAEAFRDAQRADSTFVMAYWGEAMTYNHPIWLEQDSTRARQALARLGPTREARAAAAATDRERAYLAAVEKLYGTGSKEERDFAYSDAMRAVHEAYPDDSEAAVFYALSILGTAHRGRDYSIYIRAASIVEEVFNRLPNHPGAAHYLIHSYDDPLHAPLGLRAAQAYSRIAPDAAHAQHMTSHIFVAMGMWDEVVAANENARRVARDAVTRRGAEPSGCGHYNFWLEYGYLQKGRFEDASALLRECFETARREGPRQGGAILDPDNTGRGSYAGMLARYILDTESWEDESLGWTLPLDDLFPARLTWAFANGYAAARRGALVTTEVSREAIAQTRRELDAYLAGEPNGGDASLGEAHRSRAHILELELEALLLAARHDTESAIRLVREAAEIEDGLPVFFGPPMVDKPTQELLGELLLEAGDADAAAAAFRVQLARTPRRLTAERGLRRAQDDIDGRPLPGAEESAVLATVQALFDAMAARDSAAALTVLLPGAALVGTTDSPDGSEANPLSGEAFANGLAAHAIPPLERFWDATVMIRGNIAIVWTPYDFHVGENFSHCGIDAFNLVRTSEGWRIASIVWTVEREGCEPSPLGSPGG